MREPVSQMGHGAGPGTMNGPLFQMELDQKKIPRLRGRATHLITLSLLALEHWHRVCPDSLGIR